MRNKNKISLRRELFLIVSESKTQISNDIRLITSYFFKRKKRQFKRIQKEQVIFGNWITSTYGFKTYRSIQKNIRRRRIVFKNQLSIKMLQLLLFVQAFMLRIKYFTFGAIVITFILFLISADNFARNLPNPKLLSTRDIPATTKIYDRNGILLYEIYAAENRTPVKLSDIPTYVKQATIAIEDKDFYRHEGISPSGIIRAFIHNSNSNNLEGGSTITQQLIRSTFLTPQKTVRRKLLEIFLAYWTEHLYKKDQILEMYLNQVPYGGTAWGIEAASQTYFGKSAKELTLAQGALLAGLPAAPTLYSPFGAHPDLAKYRQTQVLNQMVANGYISEKESLSAKLDDLKIRTPRISIEAPHFVMYIKDLLDAFFGVKVVATGGLRVYTTLDLSIQQSVQNIVTTHIDDLKRLSVGNGAALVINPKNGEILAMVGSSDYFNNANSGNVNVVTSLRPPGSSIKVVTYALALQNGYTAHSYINDSPVSYFDGYTSYRPVNYDGRYHGNITLRTALASSYNIPAVKILSFVGVKNMILLAQKMGITTWNNPDRFGLSLTLGAGEVTMLDMAKVYETLANEGKRFDLTPFIKITDYKGDKLALPLPHNELQAISRESAYILSSILSDDDARSPAFGKNSSLVIPGKTVAVKTGTSDSKRDNWTIGYTPDYVTAVWVGNNDNSPMHPSLTSGITGAAPIWHDIMTELTKNTPNRTFQIPGNIVTVRCGGKTEYFIKGTELKSGC